MENLMTLQPYLNQLRPRKESYVEHVDRIQNLLIETSMMSSNELIKYGGLRAKILQKAIEDGTPLETDSGTFPLTWIDDSDKESFNSTIGTADISQSLKSGSRFKKIFKNKNGEEFTIKQLVKTAMFGGKGSSGEPSGADWENIITKHFNTLVGKPDHDIEASAAAAKFVNYDDMGKILAKNIKTKIGNKPITQFGGGKSKSNLSDFWQTWGAGDGTPKTDMYNAEYNISLKKKGGSQLASGARGETLATFHAALEYLGTDRGSNPEVNKIMTAIENNFAKLSTKYSKEQLEKISQDKRKSRHLSPSDQKALTDFITTEKFHKDLNKEIMKSLSFEKQPEFLKWYTFEAMSGYKKFKIEKGKASVCLEFDANNGSISKFIEVTEGGRSAGLAGIPSVSSDVIGISKKVKVYVAWKSGSGNPYSALRLGLTNDFTTEDTTDTLRGIIRNEVLNDNIANVVLKEEIEQLDEFKIIRQTFSKLKGMGKNAMIWFKNLVSKIMTKVKQTLNKIKQLGAKMFEKLFEFLGIEPKSVRTSVPSDISGFIYGMK
jgi:hypothetical protein